MNATATIGSAGERPSEPTVLIVDDSPENLLVLGELLQAHYRVRVANSGERALRSVATPPRPDIILLDVMMPVMGGYEVLDRLRADAATRDIPVMFVTSMDGTESEAQGLAIGAVDYVTKPFRPEIVLARIRTHLELKRARDLLTTQNDWLEREVALRLRENVLVQELSVRALACVAEARDNDTGKHIVRTQAYVATLARHLAGHPRFRGALEGPRLDMIVKAAPLHDIGKVGIPDAILLKPGALSPGEFEVMKTHPTIGGHAIGKAMEQTLGSVDEDTAEHAVGAFTFLHLAQEIALGHHEKWDGSGYPAGLAGDAIPVSARLMALADVFDALTTRRVYKPAMSVAQAHEILARGRATHFDPDVFDAYAACREEFAAIALEHADGGD